MSIIVTTPDLLGEPDRALDVRPHRSQRTLKECVGSGQVSGNGKCPHGCHDNWYVEFALDRPPAGTLYCEPVE